MRAGTAPGVRQGEAGFTVVELLVGAAIGAIVLLVAVATVSRLAKSTVALDTRVQSSGAAERLMERLSTEAASAWAVYVPARDANGASNADGHELDFFSEDGSHRPYTWAYAFDPATNTITRYSFVPGNAPIVGETLGPFDAFSAATIDVSQLGATDPLFAGAHATAVRYAFPGSPAVGGNALVNVKLAASGVENDELLASATAPTTFTVVVTYTPSPAPVATATPVPLVLTTP